eukprot:CAMPEP_0202689104 /NCGR_PEP_ID=MMETSP1385-20130828/4449_1 /ASSEMBLY_ACC=CAM_ASM_000861 /TAXON_ID=933848 /ORGANISM="Elphidium margaritaceum" /LENGTH=112 /DNA_ID=CAMNT_0049344195 /DNA_START=286 /DNA_END=624 /DNA_ORIENTATION=+
MLDELHRYAKRIQNLYILPSDKKAYEHIRDYALTVADSWAEGFSYGYLASWVSCMFGNMLDNKHALDFVADAGQCLASAGKDPISYAAAAVYGTQQYFVKVSLNQDYFEFHF